jgi:hypothetical protein
LLPLNLNDKGFFILGAKLGTISAVTIAVHIAVSALFGFDEAKSVLLKAKKIIYKTVRI